MPDFFSKFIFYGYKWRKQTNNCQNFSLDTTVNRDSGISLFYPFISQNNQIKELLLSKCHILLRASLRRYNFILWTNHLIKRKKGI